MGQRREADSLPRWPVARATSAGGTLGLTAFHQCPSGTAKGQPPGQRGCASLPPGESQEPDPQKPRMPGTTPRESRGPRLILDRLSPHADPGQEAQRVTEQELPALEAEELGSEPWSPGTPWLPAPKSPGTGVEGGVEHSTASSSVGSWPQRPVGHSTSPPHTPRTCPGTGLDWALDTQCQPSPPHTARQPSLSLLSSIMGHLTTKPQGSPQVPTLRCRCGPRARAHLRWQGLRLQVPPIGPEKSRLAPGP